MNLHYGFETKILFAKKLSNMFFSSFGINPKLKRLLFLTIILGMKFQNLKLTTSSCVPFHFLFSNTDSFFFFEIFIFLDFRFVERCTMRFEIQQSPYHMIVTDSETKFPCLLTPKSNWLLAKTLQKPSPQKKFR